MAENNFVQLVAERVSKTYGSRRTGTQVAVDDVSLTLQAGEAVGVVGESGSGKSTLAKMLVGVEAPTSGTISLNGISMQAQLGERADRLAVRRAVQMVAQDTSSSFDPLRTIRDSVRRPAMRLLNLSRAAADAEVDRIVDSLELSAELADRYPEEVSGGQRQRFALARAMIVKPSLLVCDEVVSALDVSVQGAVLNILRRYCRDTGAGLVFVSHGLPATAFIADRIVVMYQGKVVEDGSTGDILHHAKHEYTAKLLQAYRGRDESPSGELVSVSAPTVGERHA